MKAVVWSLSLVGWLVSQSMAWESAKLKLTLKVVDEDGVPVGGATVTGGVWSPDVSFQALGRGEHKELIIEGRTDVGGLLVIEKKAWKDLGWGATKEGYYRTGGKYVVAGKAAPPIVSGRWQPWNPTNTVVLKRIRHPVPMYAKALRLSLPAGDQFLGYDLQVGDWVAPHGKGCVTDLEFLQHFESVGTNTVGSDVRFEGRVDIRGPTAGSGVIVTNTDTTTGSELRSLHEAPEDGYQRFVSFTYRRHGRTIETTAKSDQCLYLRTRVTTNLQGQITGAWYGKIYGSVFETFLYLMNPDGTRNVEFDFNRNLFGDSPRERVGQVP